MNSSVLFNDIVIMNCFLFHMDKNKNCSACNIKIDINNYKKNRTVCKDCYNKKKRKNKITISHQQPIIENGNFNNKNRTLLVGPSFSGKTYLMLKILSRMIDRDIYIINKSPPEQYTNSKIKIKEISDEIKPLNEYENGIIVLDDVLGSSNSRFIDQFFIRGRHNNLDIYYLSQSYFDLPKRTIRNNSNKIILFNRTLKDIEHIYRDVAGYDMNYDEFKDLCRKSWDEDYNYLFIDRSKKRDQGRYCICNESKKTYIEARPQTKLF